MTENEKAKTKKRKRCPVFIYGNYNRYYGYRVKNVSKEDPRLSLMKREWFENKECLGIGCNEGVITIDIELVQMARHNLRRMTSKLDEVPDGLQHLVSGSANGKRMHLSEETSELREDDLLRRVTFE